MTQPKILPLKTGHVILERGVLFRAYRSLFRNGILILTCQVTLDDIVWKTQANLMLRGIFENGANNVYLDSCIMSCILIWILLFRHIV